MRSKRRRRMITIKVQSKKKKKKKKKVTWCFTPSQAVRLYQGEEEDEERKKERRRRTATEKATCLVKSPALHLLLISSHQNGIDKNPIKKKKKTRQDKRTRH